MEREFNAANAFGIPQCFEPRDKMYVMLLLVDLEGTSEPITIDYGKPMFSFSVDFYHAMPEAFTWPLLMNVRRLP
ncbi:hypothetical protein F4809DRAFT_632219 [Biscogniauxia mediterranea]|nr:hypothetical protein F4809DRAFT_632219 [Biscogniauxia mediterranea]